MDVVETKPKAGLSIAALILSSLLFVPPLPLVGLMLGVVALRKGRARVPALVAVCVGAVFTVVGFAGAVFAVQMSRELREGEKIAESYRGLSAIGHALGELDEPTRRALPDADWTPPGGSRGNGFVDDDGSAWRSAPWSTLGFVPEQPHRYRYRLRHDGDGFVIEARALLDGAVRRSEVTARFAGGDEPLRFERRLSVLPERGGAASR